MKGWLYFAFVQLISFTATLIGLLLLIPFCLAKAWKPAGKIDCWSWGPLNWIYGNPQDGVSGAFALVWNRNGAQVPYMPSANPIWRAYCWSALRNSADNLKYVFAWKGGPFKRVEFHGFYFQAGWNTSGLPVLSVGQI